MGNVFLKDDIDLFETIKIAKEGLQNNFSFINNFYKKGDLYVTHCVPDKFNFESESDKDLFKGYLKNSARTYQVDENLFENLRLFVKTSADVYPDNWNLNFYVTKNKKLILTGIGYKFDKTKIRNSKNIELDLLDFRVNLNFGVYRNYSDNKHRLGISTTVSGRRDTYTEAEVATDYCHSHIAGIPAIHTGTKSTRYYDFSQKMYGNVIQECLSKSWDYSFNPFCLGSGHLKGEIFSLQNYLCDTKQKINDNHLENSYVSILTNITRLVTWESLEGGPYRRIKGVKEYRHSSSSSQQTNVFGTNSSALLNNLHIDDYIRDLTNSIIDRVRDRGVKCLKNYSYVVKEALRLIRFVYPDFKLKLRFKQSKLYGLEADILNINSFYNTLLDSFYYIYNNLTPDISSSGINTTYRFVHPEDGREVSLKLYYLCRLMININPNFNRRLVSQMSSFDDSKNFIIVNPTNCFSKFSPEQFIKDCERVKNNSENQENENIGPLLKDGREIVSKSKGPITYFRGKEVFFTVIKDDAVPVTKINNTGNIEVNKDNYRPKIDKQYFVLSSIAKDTISRLLHEYINNKIKKIDYDL